MRLRVRMTPQALFALIVVPVMALLMTGFILLGQRAEASDRQTQTVRTSAGRRIDGLLCDLDNANKDKAALAAELADALARNEALSTEIEKLGFPLVVTPAPPAPLITAVPSPCPR